MIKVSNIAWSLGGLAAPLMVAAITVPLLIDRLGVERFGFLALAWGVLGYAGILDLGIGRALTQMVSRLIGLGDYAAIPNVLATASRITLVAGMLGFGVIAFTVVVGWYSGLATKSVAVGEIYNAILLLAVALPVQAMSATYRGLSEAYMNFKGISLVRVVLGVINFGGPFLITFYTVKLPWLISVLVVSRLLALYVFRLLALRCVAGRNNDLTGGEYSFVVAKALFRFGGWASVSSVVGPLLVQSDRFLIAGLISVTAVTAYTIPYEVTVQGLFFVSAVSSVIFPGITTLMQRGEWRNEFNRWLLMVIVFMFFFTVSLGVALPVILPAWIGGNLSDESILIGQILCVGVFANSIGVMYYSVLHALGRSDVTAKLHLFELPLYALALYFLIEAYGVYGAAFAWVGRSVFDTLCLRFYSARCEVRL
jgi:O-antigen/teichoic acid export membrane protein